MKIKSIITALLMAGAVGAGAETVSQDKTLKLMDASKPASGNKSVTAITRSNKVKVKYSTYSNKVALREYFKTNQHEGKKRYIVRLADDSVPTYKGDVIGLKKTNPSALKNGLNNAKFNIESKAALEYIDYLEEKQTSFVAKASASLGSKVSKLKSFKFAINGFLTELTFDQAKKLSSMPEVASIEQDKTMQLNTDKGPLLIGADQIWDGTAGGSPYMGEGVIIGMIDTGVNTDHRSFAATGDDGYTVVNPLGDGNYKGDCLADSSLCNSKLIGVYSYPVITDAYADPIFADDTRPANGEDHNGHGSHTSSTAGGNVLDDVKFVVPDFFGGNTGDGLLTNFTYPRMSGVAPHANIISYQVCWPGNTGDAFVACPNSATIQAIDNAIADDVDVINYSIGHNPNAWDGMVELGFLSAQAAGIFVATSAGNSGPDAATTDALAPWYTAVAAATHGLADVIGEGMNFGSLAGGDTTPPADIAGVGLNGTFTGDIVWAGDFSNPNDPDGEPEQCLQPFPASTFLATQIVMCDRGAIARVQKAANAAAGGAGGFVLANVQGGAGSLPGDFYTIPGIHISADDGDLLRTWLASGAGHMGTIADAALVRSTNTPDEIASFSSRGPNGLFSIVSPQIAAPGHRIHAAWADDQPFMNVTGPAPADFSTISGTSMASPHIAGAAALVTQARPTWNPDQIRSALMMTSTTSMTKDQSGTSVPTDTWDMGAGRVQVNLAINAGLLMSESEANYTAANPAIGGDVKTLNIPSMADFSCPGSCSWTRKFTAVADGTYAFSSSSEALTMSPASFNAVAGDSFNVVFTLDVTSNDTGSTVLESISIASSGKPDLHLPVAAVVNNGAIPEDFIMTVGRDNGSWVVEGIQTISTDNLNFKIDGLFDNNAEGFNEVVPISLLEDSTNNPFDDFSEVLVSPFTIPANTVSLTITITEATSPDFDLYLLQDVSGDGTFNTIVEQAATAETNESITLQVPEAGSYAVVVQNFAASNVGATDSGVLTILTVPQTDPVEGLSVSAPTTASGSVDVQLLWDKAMVPGDSFFADITVLADTIEIGTFRATLNRTTDDFSLSADQALVTRGDEINYTLSLEPNRYNQNVSYGLSIDIPEGMTLVENSVVASGGDITIKDPNAVGLSLDSDFDIPQDPTRGDPRDDLSQVHVFLFEIPTGTVSLQAAITGSTAVDNDLFVDFDSAGDGTFATEVGRAETSAANEVVNVANPVPGMYRAIVMNWGGSSAASDTGTLAITTVPATGEGFIWGVNVGAFAPEYTVVNAADNSTCSSAGLGGASGTGGYTPLSAFGIGTMGRSGDEITIPAFETRTFNFFGQDKTGLQISDNGFVMFSGTQGSASFNNTPLPNANEPNDIIAGLWKDQIIEDDGSRGIRAASLGPIAIVDFDGLEPWTLAGDSSDRYFYQVQVMSDGVSDDHQGFGPYEVIISWAEPQIGSLAGATVGVENADGTVGFDMSDQLTVGGQLCLNYNAPPQLFEVTYTVIPTSEYRGEYVTMVATVESNLNGAQDLVVQGALVDLINVAPTAVAGDDVTYDRGTTDEVTLDASASTDLDVDRLSFEWGQTSGDSVGLRGSKAQQAFFNLGDVPNGVYRFSLTVNDGTVSSGDDIVITVTGKSNRVSGVGGIGWLLLFMAGSLFVRRKHQSS